MSNLRLGDVVRITRKDHGWGIGVVMKLYKDHGNAFVRLIKSERIFPKSRQNWKRYDVMDMQGYYIRPEDEVIVVDRAERITYAIGAHGYKVKTFHTGKDGLTRPSNSYLKNVKEDRVSTFYCRSQYGFEFVMVTLFDRTQDDVTYGSMHVLPTGATAKVRDIHIKRCWATAELARLSHVAGKL